MGKGVCAGKKKTSSEIQGRNKVHLFHFKETVVLIERGENWGFVCSLFLITFRE
jgi:hypothetical protein